MESAWDHAHCDIIFVWRIKLCNTSHTRGISLVPRPVERFVAFEFEHLSVGSVRTQLLNKFRKRSITFHFPREGRMHHVCLSPTPGLVAFACKYNMCMLFRYSSKTEPRTDPNRVEGDENGPNRQAGTLVEFVHCGPASFNWRDLFVELVEHTFSCDPTTDRSRTVGHVWQRRNISRTARSM